jgi:hypothetical protein
VQEPSFVPEPSPADKPSPFGIPGADGVKPSAERVPDNAGLLDAEHTAEDAGPLAGEHAAEDARALAEERARAEASRNSGPVGRFSNVPLEDILGKPDRKNGRDTEGESSGNSGR